METVDVELDERWAIGGKPHGGYLLRELVRPLLTQAHPHPFAVSAHYLRAPAAAAATVETETLREGRRVSQHRSRLVQDGQTCVEALVTTGLLAEDADPFWERHAPAVPLAPVEECARVPAEPFPGLRVGPLEFVDVRSGPLAGSLEESTGGIAAWARMDGRALEVADLLVLADVLPPVTLDMGLPGWAPTVELTVLVRALPADGWLRVEQRARLLSDGWLDEDCDIWDSRGRLVCQARQLAGFRAP